MCKWMQPDKQATQKLMKLKYSLFNVFINQPSMLLFMSRPALMQNIFKLCSNDDLLLAFIADAAVLVKSMSCILTSGQRCL